MAPFFFLHPAAPTTASIYKERKRATYLYTYIESFFFFLKLERTAESKAKFNQPRGR